MCAPPEDTTVNSIFSTYLGTMLEINTIDIAFLNSFTAKHNADIKDLEGRIQDIRSNIINLCNEVASLCCTIEEKKNQLKIAQSLLAPIRSLPVEILCIIFEMCLPPYDRKMTAKTAPLLLCQVSKRWRNIAIHNPRLWNSVLINVAQNSNKIAQPNCRSFVNMIIERSKGSLITLKIQDSDQPFTYGPRNHLQVLETCSRLFPQCRDLELSILSEGWQRALTRFKGTESMFGSLYSLFLTIEHWERRPFTLFENAQKLETLLLTAQHSRTLSNIILPYPQLRTLNYQLTLDSLDSGTMAISAWRELLRRSENLIEIEVDFACQKGIPASIEDNLPALDIVLDHLESLDFTLEPTGNLDVVFQDLYMPALGNFRFTASGSICQIMLDSGTQPASQMFLNFRIFSSSFNSLDSLSLLSVSIADEDILPIFRSMPRLRRLFFINFSLNRPLFRDGQRIPEDTALVRLLAQRPSNPSEQPLLPNLIDLSLSYPFHKDKHPTALNSYISMIKARCEMNAAANLVYHRGHLSNFYFMLGLCKRIIPPSLTSSIITKINTIDKERYCFTFDHRLVDDTYIYPAR